MGATGALPGCLVKIYALREEVVAWVAGYFAWISLSRYVWRVRSEELFALTACRLSRYHFRTCHGGARGRKGKFQSLLEGARVIYS